MQILAQFPGADQAIEAASKESWLAVFVVVLVFAIVAACGFILRTILNDGRAREKELNARINVLSDFVQTKLLDSLRANTEAMGKMMSSADQICAAAASMTSTLTKFVAILDVRPCLLPNADQRRLLSEFEDVQGK
jgi:hypothetical protein